MLNDILSRQILFEYGNFYQNSILYTRDNFGEFTFKMHASFTHEDLIWNAFLEKRRKSLATVKVETTLETREETQVRKRTMSEKFLKSSGPNLYQSLKM
jgi:hypothetical protein